MTRDLRQRTYWVFVGLTVLCAWRWFEPASASLGWLAAAGVAAFVAWKHRPATWADADEGYLSLHEAGVPLPPRAPGTNEAHAAETATAHAPNPSRHPPPALPAAWTQPQAWTPNLPNPEAPPPTRIVMPWHQALVVIVIAGFAYVGGLLVVATGPGYPALSPTGLAFAAIPYGVLLLALSRKGVGNVMLVVTALVFTVLGLISVGGAAEGSWEGRQWSTAIAGMLQLGAAVLVAILVAARRK